MIPQELITVYVELIKNEPDINAAAGHLVAFLEDARKIAEAIKAAVDAAKQRAQPAQ